MCLCATCCCCVTVCRFATAFQWVLTWWLFRDDQGQLRKNDIRWGQETMCAGTQAWRQRGMPRRGRVKAVYGKILAFCLPACSVSAEASPVAMHAIGNDSSILRGLTFVLGWGRQQISCQRSNQSLPGSSLTLYSSKLTGQPALLLLLLLCCAHVHRGLYDGTAFYRLADRNGNPWYGMAKRRDAIKNQQLG